MQAREDNLFSLRSQFAGRIFSGRLHNFCTIFIFGLRVTQAHANKDESYLFWALHCHITSRQIGLWTYIQEYNSVSLCQFLSEIHLLGNKFLLCQFQ
jgi:hypothetical protein